MTFLRFNLYLDNAVAVFYPGQTIKGSLHIISDKPKTTKGISIKIKGKCEVQWSEDQGQARSRHSVTYDAEEEYFKKVIHVYGNGQDEVHFNEGEHNFPFEYELLPSLPPSFEGKYGFVRYTIKASMDISWQIDPSDVLQFTVLNTLDLNRDPSYNNSFSARDEKDICCLCCKSGPVIANIHVARSGFVPGEQVRLDGRIENLSSKDLKGSKVKLIQQVTYKTEYRHKVKDVTIVKEKRNETISRRGGSQDWNNFPIIIPSLPPTTIKHFYMIEIKYFLELSIYCGSSSMDLVVKAPIVIGTVPFRNTFEQFRPSAPLLIESPYIDLPPPSYEETLGIEDRLKSKNEDDDGNLKNYLPKYAVYKLK